MKKRTSNINNLTQLWKTATEPFNGYSNYLEFNCAFVKETQWPNRIWTCSSFSNLQLECLKYNLKTYSENFTLSLFHSENEENNLTENLGLKLKSLQYGMSLNLVNKFKTQKNILLKKVTSKEEAEKWSKAFSSAFGYEISLEIILKTKESIPFYLVYSQDELIGTVILFITDTIAGIHSLGIIPQKRNQGFATEIMHHVLNKSIDLNLSIATLQASEMAKEMYLKMGFSIDFIMKNYQLK